MKEDKAKKETDYVIDRVNYPYKNIIGQIIFDYIPKYSGILMGMKGIIDGDIGKMIGGGMLYVAGGLISNLINEDNSADNLKTLEKRLKETQ